MLSYSTGAKVTHLIQKHNSHQIRLHLSVYVNSLVSFLGTDGRYHISNGGIQSAVSEEPHSPPFQSWYLKILDFFFFPIPVGFSTREWWIHHTAAKHSQTPESCNSPVWIEIIWCMRPPTSTLIPQNEASCDSPGCIFKAELCAFMANRRAVLRDLLGIFLITVLSSPAVRRICQRACLWKNNTLV